MRMFMFELRVLSAHTKVVIAVAVIHSLMSVSESNMTLDIHNSQCIILHLFLTVYCTSLCIILHRFPVERNDVAHFLTHSTTLCNCAPKPP